MIAKLEFPYMFSGDVAMKDFFSFQNLPLTIIIGLVIFSWLSLLSVLIAH